MTSETASSQAAAAAAALPEAQLTSAPAASAVPPQPSVVDVDDNVEHVVENTPYITLVHTWRSRGVHHRPHTYDVCLAGRIRTRGQLHYSCHNDSWRGGRDTNDARRHIINNEGAHAADAAVRPSNMMVTEFSMATLHQGLP